METEQEAGKVRLVPGSIVNPSRVTEAIQEVGLDLDRGFLLPLWQQASDDALRLGLHTRVPISERRVAKPLLLLHGRIFVYPRFHGLQSSEECLHSVRLTARIGNLNTLARVAQAFHISEQL